MVVQCCSKVYALVKEEMFSIWLLFFTPVPHSNVPHRDQTQTLRNLMYAATTMNTLRISYGPLALRCSAQTQYAGAMSEPIGTVVPSVDFRLLIYGMLDAIRTR